MNQSRRLVLLVVISYVGFVGDASCLDIGGPKSAEDRAQAGLYLIGIFDGGVLFPVARMVHGDWDGGALLISPRLQAVDGVQVVPLEDGRKAIRLGENRWLLNEKIGNANVSIRPFDIRDTFIVGVINIKKDGLEIDWKIEDEGQGKEMVRFTTVIPYGNK